MSGETGRRAGRPVEDQIAEVSRILTDIRSGRGASAPGVDDAVSRLAAALRGEGLSVEGRFTLKNSGEGILLTVFSGTGGGRPVEEATVRDALRAQNYSFDPDLVANAVRAATGAPVVVGPPFRDPRRDGRVKIESTPDGVRAYLVLVAPEPGGLPPRWPDIEAAVEATGIREWARGAARTALDTEQYGAEILVAAGRPSVDGRDGWVEYLFEPDPHLAPRVDEDDRVDYRSIRRFSNVRTGDVLARLHPPTPGLAGVNVKGRPLPFRHGVAAVLHTGRNVCISGGGGEATAAADGQAVLDRGMISVEPVFFVDGDLGMETGNVEFFGTVSVRGRIADGFRVRASRDVIAGSIGRAEIEADGSVVVEGGIVGAVRVAAGIDVAAKFVEGATIRAGRHVVVREAILHSNVAAGRTVFVFGGKGAVIGGQAVACEEVWCRSIGAGVGTPTLIEVGSDVAVLDRLSQVEMALARDGALLEEARKAVEVLRAGPHDDDRRKRLLALEGAIAALSPRLDAMREEALRLLDAVRSGRGARVSARDEVCAKTRISIGGVSFFASASYPFATFRLQEDGIVALPFEGPPLDRDLARIVAAADERRRGRQGS